MAEVFRKKALERRATPEHLDDYINVSNPSVWLILAAIIAFLAGTVVWGVFGSIDDIQDCVVRVKDDQAVCYVDETHAASLSVGDQVNMGGVEGRVVSVSTQAVRVDSLDEDVRAKLGTGISYVAQAELAIDLPEGTYNAEVTLESINPASLLFNSTSSAGSSSSSSASSSSSGSTGSSTSSSTGSSTSGSTGSSTSGSATSSSSNTSSKA